MLEAGTSAEKRKGREGKSKKKMRRELVWGLGFARAAECFFNVYVAGYASGGERNRMLLRLLLCLLSSKDLPVMGTRRRTLRFGICSFLFFSSSRFCLNRKAVGGGRKSKYEKSKLS